MFLFTFIVVVVVVVVVLLRFFGQNIHLELKSPKSQIILKRLRNKRP